jgi:hypothetical protein
LGKKGLREIFGNQKEERTIGLKKRKQKVLQTS